MTIKLSNAFIFTQAILSNEKKSIKKHDPQNYLEKVFSRRNIKMMIRMKIRMCTIISFILVLYVVNFKNYDKIRCK